MYFNLFLCLFPTGIIQLGTVTFFLYTSFIFSLVGPVL